MGGSFNCDVLALHKLCLKLLGLRPCSFRGIPLSLETLSEVLYGPHYLSSQQLMASEPDVASHILLSDILSDLREVKVCCWLDERCQPHIVGLVQLLKQAGICRSCRLL